jgi:hypothetical protein
MVATWQITFINSAKLVFLSFDCSGAQDGKRYLDALPVLECSFSDDQYLKVFGTGMFVLVFYCLLIPISLFVYLHKSDLTDPTVQLRFGWVYQRYHPRRWYYEAVRPSCI